MKTIPGIVQLLTGCFFSIVVQVVVFYAARVLITPAHAHIGKFLVVLGVPGILVCIALWSAFYRKYTGFALGVLIPLLFPLLFYGLCANMRLHP